MLRSTNMGFYFFYLSAFIIITAGLKAASEIVIILLLSIISASILSPIMIYAKKLKIPKILAYLFILFTVLSLFLAIFLIVENSLKDFLTNLPGYEEKIKALVIKIINFFDSYGLSIDPKAILKELDISALFKVTTKAVGNIGILLSKTVLVLIGTSFLLFETPVFEKKLAIIFKNNKEAIENFNLFSSSVKKYFIIKTSTSFLTGVCITLMLYYFDVQYAILWGFLGFLLNFIPVLGSLVAAIPAIILSLITKDINSTLWIIFWYLVINNLISNVIEPKLMGQGFGLSPAIVFFSLIFWGWVLGAAGMFLAVVLTMTIKIAFDSNPKTRWIGILLSDLSKVKNIKLSQSLYR